MFLRPRHCSLRSHCCVHGSIVLDTRESLRGDLFALSLCFSTKQWLRGVSWKRWRVKRWRRRRKLCTYQGVGVCVLRCYSRLGSLAWPAHWLLLLRHCRVLPSYWLRSVLLPRKTLCAGDVWSETHTQALSIHPHQKSLPLTSSYYPLSWHKPTDERTQRRHTHIHTHNCGLGRTNELTHLAVALTLTHTLSSGAPSASVWAVSCSVPQWMRVPMQLHPQCRLLTSPEHTRYKLARAASCRNTHSTNRSVYPCVCVFSF